MIPHFWGGHSGAAVALQPARNSHLLPHLIHLHSPGLHSCPLKDETDKYSTRKMSRQYRSVGGGQAEEGKKNLPGWLVHLSPVDQCLT